MDGLGSMFSTSPNSTTKPLRSATNSGALSAEVTHFDDSQSTAGGFLWGRSKPAEDPEAATAMFDRLEKGEVIMASKIEQTQPARMKRQWQQAHD